MASIVACALAALIGAVATAQAQTVTTNLLANPGAETGTTASWTLGGVSNPSVVAGRDPSFNNFAPPPGGGGFMFYGGSGSFGSLSQTVAIIGVQGITTASIDAGTAFANVSVFEKGLNQGPISDNGYISVTFLNASLATLSAASTAVIDFHPNDTVSWLNAAQSFAIPVGTRSITYTMNFTRNAVVNIDAYFDLNSFTVTFVPVPEPASWALIGTGLAAVAFVRRRRAAR